MTRTLGLYTIQSIQDPDEYFFVWGYSFGQAITEACKHYGTPLEQFADEFTVSLAYESSEDELEIDTNGRIV